MGGLVGISFMKRIFSIIKWTFVLLFASSILAVIAYRFIPVVATPLMFIRCFEQIGDGESIKLHHSWVSLDEMPKSMPVAVMSSEDQNFLKHHGFDYGAIERAAKADESVEAVQYPSKQQRMSSFGQAVHGCAKDWRLILHSLLNSSGVSNALWKSTSIPLRWVTAYMALKPWQNNTSTVQPANLPVPIVH